MTEQIQRLIFKMTLKLTQKGSTDSDIFFDYE